MLENILSGYQVLRSSVGLLPRATACDDGWVWWAGARWRVTLMSGYRTKRSHFVVALLNYPQHPRLRSPYLYLITAVFPLIICGHSLRYFLFWCISSKEFALSRRTWCMHWHHRSTGRSRASSVFIFVEPLFPPACRVIVVSSKSVCVEISLFKAQQSSASCVRFACVTPEEQTLEEINTKNDAKITAFHHQAESEIN